MLIAGDFNSHHSLWNTAILNPSAKAIQLANWLEKHYCCLLNSTQEQTFFRSNLRAKSIIDLAFVSRFRENTWDSWHRAEDTGSDHICIGFSAFTKHTSTYFSPLQDNQLALNKANWETFSNTLKQELTSKKILERLEQTQVAIQQLELQNLVVPSQYTQTIDKIVNEYTASIQLAIKISISIKEHVSCKIATAQ